MKKKKPPRCEVAMLVDEETGTQLKSGRFVPDRHSVEAYVFEALRAGYRHVTIVPTIFGSNGTISTLRLLARRDSKTYASTLLRSGTKRPDFNRAPVSSSTSMATSQRGGFFPFMPPFYRGSGEG